MLEDCQTQTCARRVQSETLDAACALRSGEMLSPVELTYSWHTNRANCLPPQLLALLEFVPALASDVQHLATTLDDVHKTCSCPLLCQCRQRDSCREQFFRGYNAKSILTPIHHPVRSRRWSGRCHPGSACKRHWCIAKQSASPYAAQDAIDSDRMRPVNSNLRHPGTSSRGEMVLTERFLEAR
eukprot:5377556-Amphidinium_carterae.1